MKKLLTVLFITIMIFVIGSVAFPQEAQAQEGIESGVSRPFGIGFIADFGIINSWGWGNGAIDVTISLFNGAIGWGPGHFYLHAGVVGAIPIVQSPISFSINVGAQVALHIWSDNFGLALRIPIEFEIAPFSAFPIAFFMGINPKIYFLPGVYFGMTISVGFRVYIGKFF